MKQVFIFIVLSVFVLSFAGCGKKTSDSSSGLSSVTLKNLPSISDMAKTNSAAALASFDPYLAVSGTPPTLKSITDANADTYFWNGMVAAINTAGVASTSQKDQFWGVVEAAIGGAGACYMSQATAKSFELMLEAGTSQCYMKKMPTVASGVTIDSGSPSTLFDQQTADRVVKVTTSDGMIVFIKISGSDSVTADVYKASLWFCNGSTVDGYEVFEINKTTGVFTANNSHNDFSGKGTSSISASLKVGADGNITFDETKDRIAEALYTGDWGTFHGGVTINSANKIYTKMYNKFGTWTDKNYAVASFSGTSLSDLKFLAGGYKGESGDGVHNFNYSGGTEFQNTYYVATLTSALATEAGLMTFSTDSFYSSLTAPVFSSGSYSCSTTANINVTMDFSNAAVKAVQTECESDRLTNYSYCNSAAVQAAEALLWH
ncbi:MAG: hypothetical protein HY072_06385 [Deltaproteobacteria bacterium]|nr:hypothetical protein [Deltaproteobacteria bacterium]